MMMSSSRQQYHRKNIYKIEKYIKDTNLWANLKFVLAFKHKKISIFANHRKISMWWRHFWYGTSFAKFKKFKVDTISVQNLVYSSFQ